ncbi:MAG TPA: acyl carrier protein [Microthrixaceae bacterium]|jgi:acyl carrier protein|nr:acyl carrier protein [Microthrixaceae bacterium]HQF93576.1 acyl carrier protein [Microthrixaceae bacterium]
MPAETHTHFASLDRQRIVEIVQERLGEILEIEPSTIKETDSLVDDLHADSLAQYQLVEALVDEFGERTVGPGIEVEDLEDLELVSDAVDYVVARLA